MPVLTAGGAGVRHRRRWLFRDLDVRINAGEKVAVVGPPGSGRTTVLLALTRRFRLSAGQVHLTGTAALGYVPEVSEPENVLSAAELVQERYLLLGRRPDTEINWHGLDPSLRGFELSPFQRQVLGVILARLAQPQLVALDATDEGLDESERDQLWALIDELAEDGIAVLFSARSVDDSRVATVINLGADQKEEVK
ncbi:ABC transporter ATP-binding protein [Actinoplanes sp. TFC3]|uniref:ABC transporter ATP-binding protein n=1 Tax=Actinoplanes sp. TFC3 TaxID=1710355 RepID=UPI0008349A46|nr:ABC transporter ATP-binding protein [Actinoplanes sp. TFC3]